jgi:hypothetical protein
MILLCSELQHCPSYTCGIVNSTFGINTVQHQTEVLPCGLLESEESHEESPTRYPVLQLRFELSTSKIQMFKPTSLMVQFSLVDDSSVSDGTLLSSTR